jgi:hypothetical protein
MSVYLKRERVVACFVAMKRRERSNPCGKRLVQLLPSTQSIGEFKEEKIYWRSNKRLDAEKEVSF